MPVFFVLFIIYNVSCLISLGRVLEGGGGSESPGCVDGKGKLVGPNFCVDSKFRNQQLWQIV